MAASRKENVGKRKSHYGQELDTGKIKRLKMKRKGSKSVHVGEYIFDIEVSNKM